MGESYKPMVNHLTRIILKLVEEPVPYGTLAVSEKPSPAAVRRFGERLAAHAERVAAMMEALAAKGFTFKFAKDRIFADSEEMEAQETKKYLISLGFADSEFQVLLEYARKWEVL